MTYEDSASSTLTGGVTEAPEPKKATVTKRDVTELLKSFEPEPVKTPTAAEKERARRLDTWSKAVRAVATQFEQLGGTDGSLADAAAALKALATVAKKGDAAISGLSDAKLVPSDVAPRAARAPRQSTTRTLNEADSAAAVAREAGPSDAQDDDTEASAAVEALQKVEQATEAATTAVSGVRSGPRSGPAATAAPAADLRGNEDPNANDGF